MPDPLAPTPSETEAIEAKVVRRGEELALAFILTAAYTRLPGWLAFRGPWEADLWGLQSVPLPWYNDVVQLALALALTLPTRRRSGLVVGDLRGHWRGVLVVCGGAVLATAIVYPLLPTQPWGDNPASMWAISPLSQDLVFFGYLYGRLRLAFPGYVHARVPVERGLAVTAAFFGLMHVPNLAVLPLGYVAFQFFYTGVLTSIPALSRQWTGSVWYVVLTHSAINFIAWAAS